MATHDCANRCGIAIYGRHVSDQRTRIGAAGERHALAHYVRRGCEPVATNARTRFGELDLIVIDRHTLVIAEVRTRVRGRGDPRESFDRRKRLQVRRMAAHWMSTNRLAPGTRDVRLDAVAVTVEPDGRLVSLEVLEGAL